MGTPLPRRSDLVSRRFPCRDSLRAMALCSLSLTCLQRNHLRRIVGAGPVCSEDHHNHYFKPRNLGLKRMIQTNLSIDSGLQKVSPAAVHRPLFRKTSINLAGMVSAVANDKFLSVEASAQPGWAPDSIPVLSLDEVAARLKEYSDRKRKPYGAMYSSVVGGITLDSAAMVLPLDDHMVHRGHAVFDTATIYQGELYELNAHLDRLLRSASMAKITPPFNRTELRDILVQTAAASGCREGTMRYWLSVGPGGFGLSPEECERGSFYAVVISERHKGPVEGVKVITSSVPIKPPQFATLKSTNYLQNAHVVMEAAERGAFQGIWLDHEGYIAEAANMNVAFVSKGELLFPSFANILSGCTAKRLLVLAQQLLSQSGPKKGLLKCIKETRITLEEGKAADEMMLVVSSYLIVPVIEWDGHPVGTGEVGPITKALLSIMQRDVLEGPPEVREPVPYK